MRFPYIFIEICYKMRYHLLNGFALVEEFPAEEITGVIIVTGEAFIEGPLALEFSKEYWEKREAFIMSVYGEKEDNYETQFLSQLELMDSIKPDDEVYLWFEDDLFCQTNMWFIIYYMTKFVQPQFYRVFPKEDRELWSGFGKSDAEELIELYHHSEVFTSGNIQMVKSLWEAYVHEDREKLLIHSTSDSICLRFLPEVIEAHLARIPHDDDPGRPKKLLRKIMEDGKTNFNEIFSDFSRRAGIYGFGDLQIKNFLKEMGVYFKD